MKSRIFIELFIVGIAGGLYGLYLGYNGIYYPTINYWIGMMFMFLFMLLFSNLTNGDR